MKKILLISTILFSSCLSMSKKHTTLVASASKSQAIIDKQAADYKILSGKFDSLELKVVRMAQDSIRLYNNLKLTQDRYQKLYQDGSADNMRNMRLIGESETIINERKQFAEQVQMFIKSREYSLLDIRTNAENAIKPYISSGVYTDRREGSVVIFVPDNLLFDSTDYKINDNGIKFTDHISKLLASLRGVKVTIGGHASADSGTKDSSLADEWDLSSWRAVAIARVLLKSKSIDAPSIIASGHGHWGYKLDQMGRPSGKTEIIITPKIEDIADVIERATYR